MAVVKLLIQGDMLAFPNHGSPSGQFDFGAFTVVSNDNTYITNLGTLSISGSTIGGTVTSAILGHNDAPATSFFLPTALVTGLSHKITAADNAHFLGGDLLDYQAALLSGADTITGTSTDDKIYGFGGNDTLIGGHGADQLHGGDGSDTASYIDADSAVNVFMLNMGASTGDAKDDTIDSIENLAGSNFGDFLRGNNSTNVISGNGGDDGLMGYGGGDTLDGGKGTDYADYIFSPAAVTVHLGAKGAQKGGEAAGDKYISIEGVYGSMLGDSLNGDKGDNLLNGNQGNDVLRGGKGADTLVGNIGADRFVFGAPADSNGKHRDHILDFSHDAGDTIDLRGIDGNPDHKHDQALTFIGDETFKHHHKQHPHDSGLVRYESGVISGELSGDKHADFQIAINAAVVKGDFLL